MKTYLRYLLPVFVGLLFTQLHIACEEENDLIDLDPVSNTTDASRALVDSTYTAEEPLPEAPQQRILLEDFTGVRCTNCPRAQLVATRLVRDHPGRIVLVALHGNGFFNDPYPKSKYDFRVDAVDEILDNLGGGSLPVGALNRVPEEGERLINDSKWPGMIDAQLANSSPLSLRVFSSWDPDSRTVLLSMQGQFAEAVASNLNYTFYILENGLEDIQKDGPDKIPDYVHDHVLRQVVTPALGEPLLQNPEANTAFVREMRVDLEGDWIAENCDLVGFVHLSGSNQQVLQVAKTSLVN